MADGKIPPDVLEKLEQAEDLKIEGKHEEALGILEQLLLEDPGNVAALEEVADNELMLEHFDRAKTAAAQAIKLDNASYAGHYVLGVLASRRNEWDGAIKELREANRLKPNNAEILRCLGWSLFQSGDKPAGLVTLERALNLDSDSVLTLCDLGIAYLDLEHLPKARALFLRVLDLEPGNKRAQECLEFLQTKAK